PATTRERSRRAEHLPRVRRRAGLVRVALRASARARIPRDGVWAQPGRASQQPWGPDARRFAALRSLHLELHGDLRRARHDGDRLLLGQTPLRRHQRSRWSAADLDRGAGADGRALPPQHRGAEDARPVERQLLPERLSSGTAPATYARAPRLRADRAPARSPT